MKIEFITIRKLIEFACSTTVVVTFDTIVSVIDST